jgi:peptide/nickel transport system substrate-binding protein
MLSLVRSDGGKRGSIGRRRQIARRCQGNRVKAFPRVLAGFSPATHDFCANPSNVVGDRASGRAWFCDVHPIALGASPSPLASFGDRADSIANQIEWHPEAGVRVWGWLLGFTVVITSFGVMPRVAAAADLRIGVSSEVTTLDPHFFHLTSNTEIDKLVYSALVTQDVDLKVIPDLAVSWRTLDDTHWEFKLRHGVKWQDGSAFTADDVVFTYQRARNVPNSPASFLQFLKHVVKATAAGDDTLVVETDQPDPILLNELLNVWIVSRKNGANATAADYNSGKAAIGTGPYRVVEWVPGDRMVLDRYDGYFGARPDWQRVTYKPITNDAARVAALVSGDVDLIGNVPATDVAGLQRNEKLVVATMPSNRCYFWTIDVDRDNSPQITDSDGRPMTKNPLKDVRVRRALSMAIDRDALVNRMMLGQAIAASQFMPAGVPGTSAELKPVAYDLAGARKLLVEAGYPDGFGVVINSTNDRYPGDAQVAQAAGQMWSRLGLKATVNTLPKAMYFPRAIKLEFSVLLSGNSTDTGEPLSQLQYLLGTYDPVKGIGAGNYGRYSNPRLDAILAKAAVTLDDGARNALLAQAYEVGIGDQVAVIPMLFPVTSWAMRKGISYGGFPQEATIASLVHLAK